MVEKDILLNAIRYRFTEIDNQLIFREVGGIYGVINQFTFEWKGCGWYLVDIDNSFNRIYLPHIISAFKWVEDNYKIKYNNGTGKTIFIGETP